MPTRNDAARKNYRDAKLAYARAERRYYAIVGTPSDAERELYCSAFRAVDSAREAYPPAYRAYLRANAE
jgi:hypothetical protein